MAADDPHDLPRVDQDIRINELKHEVEELSGGDLVAWESDDCPAGMAESFWQRVVDYERAPLTCAFHQLTDSGLDLPDPDAMTDAELTAKLWEVVHRLAAQRTFLYHTDHLSDRELYTHLWADSLWEATPDLPFDADSACTLDMLGGCSEDDIALHLRHYADDQERRDWLAHYPDDPMPPHEPPAHDRDRHLPRSPH